MPALQLQGGTFLQRHFCAVVQRQLSRRSVPTGEYSRRNPRKRAIGDRSRQADIGILRRGGSYRRQQIKCIADIGIRQTIGFSSGEHIAAALNHGRSAHADILTESAIIKHQRTLAPELIIHRHVVKRHRSRCIHPQVSAAIQCAARHRQTAVCLYIHLAHAGDIGIRQLHTAAVADINRAG